MLRHRIQTAIANTAGRCLSQTDGRRVVLCYHSVHPSKTYSVRPAEFERQLEWLRSFADVVPVTAIQEAPAIHEDRPIVAITFDDGYADNFHYAFPLLSKYCLPATFYVTAGFVGRDENVLEVFARIRGAEEATPLTTRQMREMSANGMDFGGHTYSHPNLAALDETETARELRLSRTYLEQELGRPVLSMAYPFGLPRRHFTERTMDAAAAAGFEQAVAVRYSAVRPDDSPYAIPRFSVLDEDLETFAAKIRGWWDYMGVWQQGAPLWMARALSLRQLRGGGE